MRLLDLFCGAGGAAMGYYRAGFTDIVGVDINPQPHYPFTFVQADAMTDPLDGVDAIHASPPCQHYSAVTPAYRRRAHPDMIGAVRQRLMVADVPYVIENVAGAAAHLRNPVMLCGSMFGLRVWRHRLFECPHVFIVRRAGCYHGRQPITVAGTGARRIRRRQNDHGGACNYPRNLAEAREAMGIDWMTRKELSQAIPPAYTEYIGRQLLAAICAAKATA